MDRVANRFARRGSWSGGRDNFAEIETKRIACLRAWRSRGEDLILHVGIRADGCKHCPTAPICRAFEHENILAKSPTNAN